MTVLLEHGVPTVDASEASADAAFEGLREHGCVLLRGAWPAIRVDGWRAPLANPRVIWSASELWANKTIYALLLKTLGAQFILAHLARDAGQATRHRERSLFEDRSYDAFMPAVGIRVFVPVTPDAALTLWPGSHHVASEQQARSLQSSTVRSAPGDALCMDTRLLRELQSPKGDHVCLTYYRKWFRDGDSFDEDTTAITRAEWQKVPEELRHLFAWRFDPYVKWRQRHVVETAISYLPSPLRAGARKLILKA